MIIKLLKNFFIKIQGKYCIKCGYKLGVWREGNMCCYHCDLITPELSLLKNREKIEVN